LSSTRPTGPEVSSDDSDISSSEVAEAQVGLGRSIATAAVIIMLGNIFSRLLGLGREVVVAQLYGTTDATAAFTIAGNLSTITYDLLVSGVVSAALVPVFSELAGRSREELWRVASTILSLVVVGLTAIVALMMVFAGPLAGVMASQFSPSQLSLTASLILVVLPGVVFLGISAVFMSLLYALQRFSFPAFAPALLNLGVIACGFLFFDPRNPFGLALGMSVGSVLMVALQLVGLRDSRLRFSLDFSHPAIRKIGKLYLPVALGLIVTETGIIIDRNLASPYPAGLAAMRFATTLVQFALGLIAAAISIAVLPTLSRQAAAGDDGAYKRTLASGLRLVIALIIPASFALACFGAPIIALAFQRGAFDEAAKWRTTLALLCYAPGTPFAAVDQLLIFAFYARQNTKTPVLVGIGSVLAYLVAATLLVGPFTFAGLALADSVKQTCHAVVSFGLLAGAVGGLRGLGLGITTLKATLAATLMGLVGSSVWLALDGRLGVGLLANLLTFALVTAAAGVTYLGAAAILRLGELQMLWGLARGRLRRTSAR